MNRRTTSVLLAAMAPVLIAILPVRSAPASTCTPAPSSAPGAIPDDAVPCNGPAPQLDAFANLAWQAFKMIVWPTAQSPLGVPKRGEPDTGRSLADMQGPRVFETFKPDWETFLPSAAQPSEWSEYSATALPCANKPQIAAGTLVLGALAEFGNVQEQAGTNPSGKPITNVLVGQNRKLARYLVAFDRNEFELIRTNKLYDALNLPPVSNIPPGPTTAAANGTIIVKSAWLELDGLNLDPATFYRRPALVQDPETLACKEAVVGLVGLHIRYKTPTRPQWIWATFEHIRNVPPAGHEARENSARATDRYSGYVFNDGTGTPMPDEPPPDTLVQSSQFSAHPDPYNVERLKPIPHDVETANANWQAALAGTVWANYQLVMVEWPGLGGSSQIDALAAKPEPPSFSSQQSNLVNTTMETFLQKRVGPSPDGIRLTCMGCHNRVQAFDYVFTIPINASKSEVMIPSPWRRGVIDFLTTLVNSPVTPR
jgi:hypothetical protein